MDLNNYLELYAEKYVCESIYNNLNQIFKYNDKLKNYLLDLIKYSMILSIYFSYNKKKGEVSLPKY